MRSFLALPIPEPALSALLKVQATLPDGRPVPEDNLHLTLAFLDDAPEQALQDIHEDLSTVRLPAPEVAFGRLGTFAEMRQGLVFAEVDPNDALTALQAKLARIARAAGVDLPRRRFRPHVTLTRSNRQPDGPARDRLAAALTMPLAVPSFVADTLTLYRSDLGQRGARHIVLAEYPLG